MSDFRPRDCWSDSRRSSHYQVLLGWVTLCLFRYVCIQHLCQLRFSSLQCRIVKYVLVWPQLRWGAFTCVGWQVELCDPIWQVVLHSFEMGFLQRAIRRLYMAFIQHLDDVPLRVADWVDMTLCLCSYVDRQRVNSQSSATCMAQRGTSHSSSNSVMYYGWQTVFLWKCTWEVWITEAPMDLLSTRGDLSLCKVKSWCSVKLC